MSGDELTTSVPAGITILTQDEAKKFMLIDQTYGDGEFKADCKIFEATNGADTGKEIKYDEDWLNMQPKTGVLVQIYEQNGDTPIVATVKYKGTQLTVDQIKTIAYAGVPAGKQVNKVWKDAACTSEEVTDSITLDGSEVKLYVTYEEKSAVTELMSAGAVTAKSTKDSSKDGYEFQSYDGTLFKLEPAADPSDDTGVKTIKYVKYDAPAGDWMKDQTATTLGGSLSLNNWLLPTGGTPRPIKLTNKSAKEIEITLYYFPTDGKMELKSGQTSTTYNFKSGTKIKVIKDGDATTGYLNGINGQEGTTLNTTASEKPIYQVTFKIPGSAVVNIDTDSNRMAIFGIYATDTPAS